VIVVPPSDQPHVSVVIVAAKRAERLVGCIEGVVREAPRDVGLEVVVVPNAAEPGLREALEGEVEGVRIVESEVPLGFAGGVNLGARHARGETLHVLHDDAEVCPGWLDGLLAALDERPEAGAVGSLVLNMDGTVQSGGHVLWRDGRTGPVPADLLPTAASYPVDYCASASLLVRREAWDAIGGLDEGFHPAYYVDVDMAMALRRAGYTIVCEPRSRVRHVRGGSSREAFRTFVSGRNRERFTAKWAEDLGHQEPYADDGEAHARARQAAERRARAVAAGPRPARAGAPAAPPEAESDALLRERRQLLRDIAVKDAYVEELERIRAFADSELVRRAEAQERLEADGALAQRALEDLGAEIDRLRQRLEVLDAIEAGGWWRLRRRLVRLRDIARRLVRRPSPDNRTASE
jgi:GT2 family glycosyltransferase